MSNALDEALFLKYGGMKLGSENTQWMTRLAVRDNLLCNDIPHVPILVDDIAKYVALVDYEENCIKRIQTIGELSQLSGRSGIIANIMSTNNHVSFPIDLTNLSLDAYYYKGTDNTHATIWKQNIVFKVFGTLVHKDGNVILAASQLVPVKNIKSSWLVIYKLSKMARREYRQYYRAPELDKLTKHVWEEMLVEEKRRAAE